MKIGGGELLMGMEVLVRAMTALSACLERYQAKLDPRAFASTEGFLS